MSYKVQIWYAEHSSVGDKFYKVMRFVSTKARMSFAVFHYGPRAVHIALDTASTGTVSVTEMSPTVSAGADKETEKEQKGYTENSQRTELEFKDQASLQKYIKDKFKSDAARQMRETMKKGAFLVPDLPDPAWAPPDDKPVGPCQLSESEGYGTW